MTLTKRGAGQRHAYLDCSRQSTWVNIRHHKRMCSEAGSSRDRCSCLGKLESNIRSRSHDLLTDHQTWYASAGVSCSISGHTVASVWCCASSLEVAETVAYCTNRQMSAVLCINPFVFKPGKHPPVSVALYPASQRHASFLSHVPWLLHASWQTAIVNDDNESECKNAK